MAFEIKNTDEITKDMLDNIDDKFEKSQGFLTEALVKSMAIELSLAYKTIEELEKKIDVDNLTGDELTKYVLQRKGIVRKLATKAKVELTLTGSGNITKNSIFSTANGIIFRSLEEKAITTTGTIEVECDISGTQGNVGSGSIVQFPVTITGFTAVTNLKGSTGGFAEEDDETLRDRYYDALRDTVTSNNVYAFEKWSKQVSGVSEVEVRKAYTSPSTVVEALGVDVYILNQDKLPASTELIKEVQEYIDPMGANNATWGSGLGKSSIGNYTTIKTAVEVPINIETTITKASGYDTDEIKTEITEQVTEYLKEIAYDSNHPFTSYAKISSIILNIQGVEDVTNLKLNNTTSNVGINIPSQVATIGNVVIS